MFRARKASFKDSLFIGMHQGEPHPVFQDRVSDCTFTRCKHQTVFLYYMSVKYILRGYLWCFWCPRYVLVVLSNRWNQYNFSTLHRLYKWGHRWILILLLIFADWYKHSNTNVAGWKCILNRFCGLIWRPKRLLTNMSTLHNGLHNKFGLSVFPIFTGFAFDIYWLFIVPNLKRIHAVFAMFWPFQ